MLSQTAATSPGKLHLWILVVPLADLILEPPSVPASPAPASLWQALPPAQNPAFKRPTRLSFLCERARHHDKHSRMSKATALIHASTSAPSTCSRWRHQPVAPPLAPATPPGGLLLESLTAASFAPYQSPFRAGCPETGSAASGEWSHRAALGRRR